MVISARSTRFIVSCSILNLYFMVTPVHSEEPTTLAVGKAQEKLINSRSLQKPVTEPRVNDLVNFVRWQLKEVKTPQSLDHRDFYVKELRQVLERFVVKDVMRANLKPTENQLLWLSDRTAARVIRLMGDLNAVEAVETLVEYLLLPWDLDLERLQGPEGQPTTWALFQIGDASLPFLRNKMTSDGNLVPRRAAHTAALILGPRADQTLDNWIKAAETLELKKQLEVFVPFFSGTTQRAITRSLFTPEAYREFIFKEQRPIIEKFMDRPTLEEINEWKQKLKDIGLEK